MSKKIMARSYGTVIIARGTCNSCGEECIICKDNKSACCNSSVDKFTEGRIISECGGVNKRKAPTIRKQTELLEAQYGKCYWCGREFGDFVLSPKGKVREVVPVWDHYIPYWYTLSCRDDEFVASCLNCNQYKSGMIITSKDEENDLRGYLKKRFFDKGWQEIR